MNQLFIEENIVFKQEGVTGYKLKTCGDAAIILLDIKGGHNTYCRYHGGEQTFLVTSGNGIFDVGENILHVKSGDQIIVPCGEIYTYAGEFQMLQIQLPAPKDLTLFEDIKENNYFKQTMGR